jgi:hypothetical protein
MRELHHPRADSVDLEAAALLLVRRVYGEAVRMLGHGHPISVRLWELISAETGSSPASQQVESTGEVALFGGWRK